MTRKTVVNFDPSFLQQTGPIIQVIIEHPKLEQEEADLELKILNAKIHLDIALDKEATTLAELNQFSSLKAEMKKNGVDMLDGHKFVAAVVGAR